MKVVQPDVSQDVSCVLSYSNIYTKQQKITLPAHHLMQWKELLLIASREPFRLTKVVKKKW